MADAIVVMRSNGILRPEITQRAAAACGLDLASACAMIMGESGGGRMVWGSDGVQTGGTYTKGGPVTRANYLAYRAAMKAGKIGRQGVGDAQLTSAEYQDRGDALGGCWDPYANQLAGFTGLANLQKRYGLQDGFRRYNGSGPAAEAYGRKRLAERNTWAQRLGGTGAAASGGSELNEGDTGPAVLAVQRWLNATFPAYSKIDLAPQRYGPQTVGVVAEFQRRSGISGGDGKNIGPQTLAAMKAAGYRP